MITYETIRAIARKDNEENPNKFGFEDFEVEDDAAVQFAKTSVQVHTPHLMDGSMSLEQALTYSCLGGMRMGMLISRELAEQAPDTPPQEWSA